MSRKFGGVKTLAGLSFIGFCAASVIADRVDLNAMASQLAGFAGAFLGAVVARGRSRHKLAGTDVQSPAGSDARADSTSIETRER